MADCQARCRMSVFRNYNSRQAGGVNANAFPRVHSIPWVPTQNNVRTNPNIPSQPQRIQPHERGTFFPTSASSSGTLAPQMSSGCAGGCSGCASGCSQAETAVDVATAHGFPTTTAVVKGTMKAAPRPAPRTVGALRSGIRPGTKRRSMSQPMFGGRL